MSLLQGPNELLIQGILKQQLASSLERRSSYYKATSQASKETESQLISL